MSTDQHARVFLVPVYISWTVYTEANYPFPAAPATRRKHSQERCAGQPVTTALPAMVWDWAMGLGSGIGLWFPGSNMTFRPPLAVKLTGFRDSLSVSWCHGVLLRPSCSLGVISPGQLPKVRRCCGQGRGSWGVGRGTRGCRKRPRKLRGGNYASKSRVPRIKHPQELRGGNCASKSPVRRIKRPRGLRGGKYASQSHVQRVRRARAHQ